MINETRLLEQFLEFVQIDSESGSEKAMAERLMAACEALGLEVSAESCGDKYATDGFNVFAKLEGEGEPILLSAHMDTVVPGKGVKPVIRDGIIYSDGTTVLGGDDKSGICGILEAIQVIREQELPHRAAEIVFSVGEEVGMWGAKTFDAAKLKAKQGYVFDSSGDVGKVIVQAPGQVKVFADVLGRRAHAGIAPEEGISAIQVMAHAIAKMNLLRIDPETTCNIGTIKAEYATNIVPDCCHIMAEVRSRNLDKLNAQAAHLQDCLKAACEEFGAQLKCELRTNYVSYRVDESSPLLTRLVEAIRSIGCTPNLCGGGGGSDANIYNQKGIECVVLGTGMTKVHTKEESIKIDNLNKTAELALALLKA